MHWTPEHAQPLNQWPEQHLDVSSTTSSPAHKSDLYHNSRQRFNYAWANDDISALTASNLLKRYAEKYSGVLDSPYDRPPALNAYGDGAFGPLNGQKGEMEPWPMAHSSEGAYPLTPIHDGLSGSKGIIPSAVAPGNSLGTSPVVSSNLSDSIYPSNTCGPPAASGSLGTSQEYPTGYSGAYLPSGYCSQPASALPPPHPSTLHSSGLLQPTHPSTTLVPGYSSSGPMYNYASGSYPPQAAYATIHPPHHSASYLPSGIAAPTPIPPSPRTPVVPGYSYQSPLPVPPLSNEPGNSLKRKAFDVTGSGEDDGEGRYRKYSYEQPKSPYQMSDSGECRGNGFNRSAEVPFKGGKRPAGTGVGAAVTSEEPIGKYASQPMKGLVSPAYNVGEAPLGSSESFEKFSPPAANGEREGESFALRMQPKASAFGSDSSSSGGSQAVQEQLKTMDPFILELVNNKIIDCSPPVQWTDIAGHVSVKAAIEEELVWPILRPGAYTGASRPPKTILLFGPSGVGKTLLSRCISTQLGSTLLKLSGNTLVSKWKAEAEKILQATFYVSNCRQPAVVLLTDVESLLEDTAILKSQLLSYLDNLATSGEQNVVVIATTTRPGSLDEATQRRFARRFYIAPPGGVARQQILHQALAHQNYCLSEREMASIVQLTESYSGSELLQLCQQAGANQLHSSLPGQLQPTSYKDFESLFCKIHPAVSQKELDLYVEWDKMYGSRH